MYLSLQARACTNPHNAGNYNYLDFFILINFFMQEVMVTVALGLTGELYLFISNTACTLFIYGFTAYSTIHIQKKA